MEWKLYISALYFLDILVFPFTNVLQNYQATWLLILVNMMIFGGIDLAYFEFDFISKEIYNKNEKSSLDLLGVKLET